MKHTLNRWGWKGALAASALVLAALACGGGSGGGSAPPQAVTQAPATEASGGGSMPKVDPCAILTKDDATTFFGEPSTDGRASVGDTTAFCLYQTADNVGTMSLNLSYEAGGALNSQEFAMTKSGETTGDSQAVAGLGEGAYYDTKVKFLLVAKGPWLVRVSGSVHGTVAGVDTLTPLAQKALGRLP